MLTRVIQHLHRDTLLRNSIYLMLATATMAGFGFFFWLINARLFSIENVGLATTLISVMTLIATLSLIGFNAAFVRFLPKSSTKNEHMNTGLLMVSIASIVLAVVFIAFVRFISPQLSVVEENPWYALIFVVACVMTALNILTDSIFLANKQAKFTLIIDALFSLFKMLAPFAFIGFGAIGIFTAAALAQTLGTILSIAAMIKWFQYRPKFVITPGVLQGIWRYCAANYLAGVFNLLPVTLLPIIIINHLGAASAAYYYIAMMIATLLYEIPYATTKSLFAEGSHNEASLSANAKKSIQMIALLLIPATLILFVGSGELLRIFGSAYEGGGSTFLRLLVVAGVAVSAYSLTNALFQVKKDSRAIIIVNVCYALSILALSYLLLPWGLTGIGIAWISGNLFAALVGYALDRWQPYVVEAVDATTHNRLAMLRFKLRYMLALVRNGFKRNTILFYPDSPQVWHILYRMCHSLGYRISNDPESPFDLAIAFCDTTTRKNDATLQHLSLKHTVVNLRCADISKEHVEEVFTEVFGYGMSIDPRTYPGPYVKKSNLNSTHDGTILQGRSEPKEGYIYQKLVNNSAGDGTFKDIRVHIFKDQIPFVLYRYKSATDRFDDNLRAEWVDTDKALSQEEQRQIIRFCHTFGLDYGELDVLRDADDGKLYIVDANNTPTGPRPGVQVSKAFYRVFLHTLSQTFASEFMEEKRLVIQRSVAHGADTSGN